MGTTLKLVTKKISEVFASFEKHGYWSIKEDSCYKHTSRFTLTHSSVYDALYPHWSSMNTWNHYDSI